jgi:cytochrome c oxidase subunit 2
VKQVSHNTMLEVTWSVIPTMLVIMIFWWGVKTYMNLIVVPRGAIEMQVSARKWMWSFEYPSGKRDSAVLHVPLNTPVKLIMSSDDVIHSFFVPDFRVKQDVVPGRYTTLWFQATQLGEHQVFCTEYCGTGHSDMWAKVIVDTPEEYQKYVTANVDVEPTAKVGAELFEKNACVTCHTTDGSPKIGPTFKGLFGRTEALTDGSTLTVDENYIRESIVDPTAKVVKGFQPVMPPFKGVLTDNQIKALIAFIKEQK